MTDTDKFLEKNCHKCEALHATISMSQCRYNVMLTRLGVPDIMACGDDCKWLIEPSLKALRDAKKTPRAGPSTAIATHAKLKKIHAHRRKIGMATKRKIIKELSKKGVRQKVIARRFNISPARVSQINRGIS